MDSTCLILQEPWTNRALFKWYPSEEATSSCQYPLLPLINPSVRFRSKPTFLVDVSLCPLLGRLFCIAQSLSLPGQHWCIGHNQTLQGRQVAVPASSKLHLYVPMPNDLASLAIHDLEVGITEIWTFQYTTCFINPYPESVIGKYRIDAEAITEDHSPRPFQP
jgi:hypothetical protein